MFDFVLKMLDFTGQAPSKVQEASVGGDVQAAADELPAVPWAR